MNEKFIQKLRGYAEKLVEKEKDKYITGMKNDYFSFDDSKHELFEAAGLARFLSVENAELKKKVKFLDDKNNEFEEENRISV